SDELTLQRTNPHHLIFNSSATAGLKTILLFFLASSNQHTSYKASISSRGSMLVFGHFTLFAVAK
ncbi:hypothetical protein, partial [Parasynechococcus sp.]|uniref:hypothetical protein n=1 Tax=Parasynechococcus sp. TaxID=3101203 RepID=UPI003703D819